MISLHIQSNITIRRVQFACQCALQVKSAWWRANLEEEPIVFQQRVPLLHNTLIHTQASVSLDFWLKIFPFVPFASTSLAPSPRPSLHLRFLKLFHLNNGGKFQGLGIISMTIMLFMGNVNVKYFLTKSVQKLLAPLIVWCVSIATDAENKLRRDALPVIYET